MKTIIVLVGILAIAAAGLYFFGGYRSFDPSEQGRKAKAAIKAGMPWTAVVTTAGEPQEFRHFIREPAKRAKALPSVKLGPPVRFRSDVLTQQVANNELPDGFVFIYHFSNKVAFEVTFNNVGAAMSIGDVMTMADLLGNQ